MGRNALSRTDAVGKYSTIATTRRGLNWLAAITVVWVLLLFLLMGWWGMVVYTQAEKIAELRTLAGESSPRTQAEWSRTQRMLVGEACAYFILLAGLTGAMAWLYWRDRRRTKALQAFLASVTHELKTPLTSIRLQAESLGETVPHNELIGRLLEDTSRLEAQVEKTLELARLEGGGALMLQALPIVTWLERFRASAENPQTLQMDIRTSAASANPLVLADPNALQIILRNLVENTVRHSQTVPARAHISIVEEPAHLCVTFADEGRGFTGDTRQLGSLFFRGAASHGAGVGLYLIRTLMERMHGRATFAPRPGSGFETRLYFRRSEEVT